MTEQNITTDWDCEIDPPAILAIIGAGPVGIETATYARFLGYDVLLFDIGRPARMLKRWHQRSMNQPVAKITTPLGWAALQAQYESTPEVISINKNDVWNGQQFEQTYLTPLAKTDLLYESVFFNTSVVEISRVNFHSLEMDDLQARCNDEFYLVVDSANRGMHTVRADVIIDTRGNHCYFAGLGPGGSQAIGQAACADKFLEFFPLDLQFKKSQCEGLKTLIQGCGIQAQRFASEFAQVEWRDPTTRLIWLVRAAQHNVAVELIERLALQNPSAKEQIQTIQCKGISQIGMRETDWHLNLLLPDDCSLELDVQQVWNQIQPDNNHRLAPTLNLQPRPNTLVTSEPHYYQMPRIDASNQDGLGVAYAAIVKLFSLLGGRENLNLYETI